MTMHHCLSELHVFILDVSIDPCDLSSSQFFFIIIIFYFSCHIKMICGYHYIEVKFLCCGKNHTLNLLMLLILLQSHFLRPDGNP
jgi:hypothetical protein